jgi:hypothetical protein
MNKYTITLELIVKGDSMDDARNEVEMLIDYNLAELLGENGSITIMEETI